MKSDNEKMLVDKAIFQSLDKHNDVLKKFKVRKIGLFGSFVRGEQKKNSDIDFLVEFDEPTFDNFMDLLFKLEKIFDRKIELITNGSLSPYMQPFVEKEVKWYEV
jgi:hypothetical protein